MADVVVCPPGTVPALPRVNVERLWYCGFWDGPLNGVGLVDGDPVWWQCPRGNEADRHRVFVVYPLTPAEYDDELKWHELFRVHVRDGATVHPQEGWHLYYDRAKDRLPRCYTDREPLGYWSRPSSHRRSRSVRYWSARRGLRA